MSMEPRWSEVIWMWNRLSSVTDDVTSLAIFRPRFQTKLCLKGRNKVYVESKARMVVELSQSTLHPPFFCKYSHTNSQNEYGWCWLFDSSKRFAELQISLKPYQIPFTFELLLKQLPFDFSSTLPINWSTLPTFLDDLPIFYSNVFPIWSIGWLY